MFINAEIGFTTYALYVIKANAQHIVNSPFIIKSPLNIYNNAFTTVSITTSSGCINVMNDEPKRQQIIPGKYFLYSHNILQIRYHVFPFSLISNCHPHYSLSKILTNKLIYILYIVSYSYSIFCIQFIHIIFTHNIHIYI